ncbi:MAG: hypothetical protein HY769_04965 [Candidatus Stahlbacteria bacterium]|nr:hypothetical protein [Candidatus Stahlbacteria bacterium]
MRRFFLKLLFFAALISIVSVSCEQKKLKSTKINLPPSEQVIRDARSYIINEVATLRRYGIEPTNFKVDRIEIDEYEKDLCVALVSYNIGGLTGKVGVSYRLADGFWKCTGVRELGLK